LKAVTLSANTSWYLYNFRASTIRRLLEDGYRVLCLSPEDKYSRKLVSELGCEWLPLKMNNQSSNPLKDAFLVWQFFRLYRRFKPVAVLHFTIKNNVYGTWAARILSIPAINNVSGLGTAFIRRGFVGNVVRVLYRTSQPFAHKVFCQNAEDARQLISNKLVPASSLELLPGSGVDLDRFNPQKRESHEDIFRFLYAGRMLADKGLYELVEAVRGLNAAETQCSLWLSGFADVQNVSAISGQELDAWGKEPFIEWLGPSDSMEDIFSQVDAVVLPSYREGMPRSLLEAGAMGLPVIATDVPGCRTIVEDGFNGLLCEVKSSTSLMQVMVKMLAMSDEERSCLGRNGRALVSEQYSEGLVVEATMRVVASAVES
jgi:glycosyltransferase involved in cell wall biosynthesis